MKQVLIVAYSAAYFCLGIVYCPLVFQNMYAMAPITSNTNTIKPSLPLRLSCFITQIKNAVNGNTKTKKNTTEAYMAEQ